MTWIRGLANSWLLKNPMKVEQMSYCLASWVISNGQWRKFCVDSAGAENSISKIWHLRLVLLENVTYSWTKPSPFAKLIYMYWTQHFQYLMLTHHHSSDSLREMEGNCVAGFLHILSPGCLMLGWMLYNEDIINK